MEGKLTENLQSPMERARLATGCTERSLYKALAIQRNGHPSLSKLMMSGELPFVDVPYIVSKAPMGAQSALVALGCKRMKVFAKHFREGGMALALSVLAVHVVEAMQSGTLSGEYDF